MTDRNVAGESLLLLAFIVGISANEAQSDNVRVCGLLVALVLLVVGLVLMRRAAKSKHE